MTDAVLTVRQLTDQLRGVVEGRFPFVWVRGEVTNLSRPASGHLYFSLKDSDAQLNCVWFRHRQRAQETFDPLTGEVFEDGPRPSLADAVRNGQQVCCAGGIAVYAPRGSYQLMVEFAQEAGQGQLAALFEALKQTLRERGFFAPERKRPLPPSPARVAVITAPAGAAVQDFIRLAALRGSGAELRIYPALMQGDAAAQDIIRALQRVNAEGWAQVAVLIRGGGSLEDLWAFNDEALAEAVFHSALPVVAGIGHEVDFTLVDLTADVRAATPSHAAQLLWPERAELRAAVDALEGRVQRAAETCVGRCLRNFSHAEALLGMCSPARRLARDVERLEGLTSMLGTAGRRLWQQRRAVLGAAAGALRLCRPALRLAAEAEKRVRLEKSLCDTFTLRLSAAERRWQELETSLRRAAVARVAEAASTLDTLTLRLEKHTPDAPVQRGFALLHTADGRVVTSAAAVNAGDSLRVTLRDGTLVVMVREKEMDA